MVRGQGEREFSYSDVDFQNVSRILYKMSGINLRESKKQLVYSRLARRLRALKLNTFTAYLNYLENNPSENEEFVNALTTNLTSFFRESHHFDILKKYVSTHAQRGRPFRVWCSASSTGEEPYSIAMTLVEAFGRYDAPVEILASDIDSNVLKTASNGVYSLDRLDSLTIQQKKQFFMRGKGDNDGKARVMKEVRDLIRFEQINLLHDNWPLKGHFDVIFCRNVMIYFDKPTQQTILEKMVKYLQPEGLYIAGHSESFGHLPQLVKLIDKTTYVLAQSQYAQSFQRRRVAS